MISTLHILQVLPITKASLSLNYVLTFHVKTLQMQYTDHLQNLAFQICQQVLTIKLCSYFPQYVNICWPSDL